jgi:hypothetical protein
VPHSRLFLNETQGQIQVTLQTEGGISLEEKLRSPKTRKRSTAGGRKK